MALVSCSECGKQVSDRAPACPSCGNPMSTDMQPRPSPGAVARSAPLQNEEQSFYSNQKGVRVTNTRIIIGPQTYSLANVSSVSLFTKPANRPAPFLIGGGMALIGIVALMGAARAKDGQFGCGLFALVAGAVLIAIGVVLKDQHFVRLTAAGGESNVLQSTDKSYIGSIVAAINEAIVSRG